MNKILRSLQSLLTSLGERWVVVKDGWAAIRPTWIAALIAIAATVALQNAQALDALKEILLDRAGFRPRIMLFLSAALVSFAAWYFPRALLYVSYPRHTPANPERHQPLRTWGPRLLGLLPLLSLTLAHVKVRAFGFAALYLLAAGVFLTFLIRRRRGRPAPPLQDSLPRPTFWVAFWIQVLLLACLAVFLIWKVGVPQFFGPLGILLLAAAMWISLGSMLLIYPTYKYSTPSGVFLLLVLAGTFSCWNDNHQIRVARRQVDSADWRQPFDAHLRDWKRARRLTPGRERTYPLFVVTAEGGGIRAAYWTASVLAQLEDHLPGFACHLFAISGVSGGSLGGAVFASLVGELVEEGRLRCDGSPPPRAEEQRLVPKTHQILRRDFLAPTLAGMFFPDFVQRFWPFPKEIAGGWLAFPDRATYLERSWESAFYVESGRQVRTGLGKPFRDLWAGERRYLVPSLFLNGTWVENGGRVVTTNLRTEVKGVESQPEEAGTRAGRWVAAPRGFVRLDDMIGCLGRSIRLSTAVHMSARFTYVSPAGTVQVADPSRCLAAEGQREARLHVVDGGYFENSGALTAAEIVDELGAERRWRGRIYTLIISNNPDNPNADSSADGDGDNGSEGDRLPFGEILSPILALLNTRSARGYYAESFLADPETSLRFQLVSEPTVQGRRRKEPEEATFPLGWTLSPETEARMQRQAAANPNIARVGEWLRASTGASSRARPTTE